MPIGVRSGNAMAAPTRRVTTFPTTTRRPAASPPRAPSMSGLSAVPMFAPMIRASAALRGMTPFSVKDITSSATATLEWAAQASKAPKATEIRRSVAIAPMRILRLGTSS